MASLIKHDSRHPKLIALYNIPQTEQKSQAWLNQRKKYLTSSDAGTALGLNHYQKPIELLFSKCGAGEPFSGNEATRWGEKYEDEAIEHYCNAMGMKQHEFGLIPWEDVARAPDDLVIPDSHFLAGSPDGVALPQTELEDGDPVLLEVKCPFRRKIELGQCPEHYYPQVVLNMYICNVKHAAFIEYKPAPAGQFDAMTLNIVHYERDDDWLRENIPRLKEFWGQVEYWRKNGIENHPEYKKYAWTPERIAKKVARDQAAEEKKRAAELATVKEMSAPCMLGDDSDEDD